MNRRLNIAFLSVLALLCVISIVQGHGQWVLAAAAIAVPASMRKNYTVQIKEMNISDEGKGRIVFATMNQVDKDGDLTDPGAFGNQLAHLLPMHVWKDADTPFLGVAQISEARNKAIARFELNMDLQRARDWHSSLKFALDRGKTIEWSYGFDVVDSEMRTVDGKSVRVLKKLLVHEVSPVVVGAGNNTRTLDMKAYASIPGSWEKTQESIRETASSLLFPSEDGWVGIEATFSDRVIVCAYGGEDMKYFQFNWELRVDGVAVLSNQAEVALDLVIREKSLKLESQFFRLLDGLKVFTDRSKTLAALRSKEGRVLSAATRSRLTRLQPMLTDAADELKRLLDETDPESGKALNQLEGDALFAEFERSRRRFGGQ
jgi:phage head maturation protease